MIGIVKTEGARYEENLRYDKEARLVKEVKNSWKRGPTLKTIVMKQKSEVNGSYNETQRKYFKSYWEREA